MKKQYLIICMVGLVLIAPGLAKASIPVIWQADPNGSYLDTNITGNGITRVKLTPDNNYVMVFHYNGGQYGIPTRVDKLDASTGNFVWPDNKDYPGNEDYFKEVQKPGERLSLNGWVDCNGNLYIMGSWSGYTIWKYDPNLETELCSYTGGSGFEYVRNAIDDCEYLYVSGMTGSGSNQGSRLVKLDLDNCNEICSIVSKHTSAKDEYGLGIALDSSKNVFRVGMDSSFGASDHGRLIGHSNIDCSEICNYTVNESNSKITGITIDSDDYVYIAYCYNYTPAGQERTVVQKLVRSGGTASVVWEYIFDDIGMYLPHDAIIKHTENSFYVAFNVRQDSTTLPGIAEFDLDGNLLWKETIDRRGWNLGSGIDAYEDYIYVGLTNDADASQTQVLCLAPEPPCELIPEEIASMDVGHNGAGVVSYDGKLYVWTGYTNYGPTHYNRTAKMEIYDPDANTWSDGADIPQVKSQPACFDLNGKFYTVGGETNPSGSFTNTVHRYDPNADSWTTMNNFPRRIWQGSGVGCGGKAYVFGGATGYGNPLSSVYEYDEASDAWIPKAPMLTGVSYPAAVCSDNKIWVFGGVASFHPTTITKEIQIYDPSANTWESGGDMHWKLNGMQAIVYNNDIWLFASSLYDEGTADWVDNEYAYQFSPETSEWTRHPFPRTLTLPIEPYYGSKLALINGYVYLTHTYDTTTHENSERAFKVKICELALTVAVDIKPGSCPNPLNVKNKGLLPVAILGTEDFDVNGIDMASIRLEDVAPIRSSYEDVATPVVDGNECDCNSAGPDDYTDLTLKFKTQEIVEALGDVNDGDVLSLTLTGSLSDETPIEGEDCVSIVGRFKPFSKGDLNKDGIVNMLDMGIIIKSWLESSIVED